MRTDQASLTRRTAVLDAITRRHRLCIIEAAPWLVAILIGTAFPEYLSFGAQVMAMILLALSVDLIVGYAGVITLGQAAFYGTGAYTAGLLSVYGWTEPLSGLVVAAIAGVVVGAATGFVILRAKSLTVLMLTLMISMMLYEAANKAVSLTGGADGLRGIVMKPVLGSFAFDFMGHTAYWYSLAVLFLGWVAARRIVYSPFGHALAGIRENPARMQAIGIPVHRRLVTIYAISAAMAAVAGALQAQSNQFVGLRAFSLEQSSDALLMVIVGGTGRLYGAFIGAPLYMSAQDTFSKQSPLHWYLWMGLCLGALVLFVRGGIFDLFTYIIGDCDEASGDCCPHS